jgi:hypothetical protein
MKHKQIIQSNRKQRVAIIGIIFLIIIAISVAVFSLRKSTDSETTKPAQSEETHDQKKPSDTTSDTPLQSGQPAPSQSQPPQSPATTPTVSPCDTTKKNTFESTYNAAVAQENSTHDYNLQNNPYDPNDISSRSNYQRFIIEENNRHQAALTSLENNYQQQLKSINC